MAKAPESRRGIRSPEHPLPKDRHPLRCVLRAPASDHKPGSHHKLRSQWLPLAATRTRTRCNGRYTQDHLSCVPPVSRWALGEVARSSLPACLKLQTCNHTVRGNNCMQTCSVKDSHAYESQAWHPRLKRNEPQQLRQLSLQLAPSFGGRLAL